MPPPFSPSAWRLRRPSLWPSRKRSPIEQPPSRKPATTSSRPRRPFWRLEARLHPCASRSARGRKSPWKHGGKWPKPALSPSITTIARTCSNRSLAARSYSSRSPTAAERPSPSESHSLPPRKSAADARDRAPPKAGRRSCHRSHAAAPLKMLGPIVMPPWRTIGKSRQASKPPSRRPMLQDSSCPTIRLCHWQSRRSKTSLVDLQKAGLPLQARLDAAVASLAEATDRHKRRKPHSRRAWMRRPGARRM